MILPFLSFLPDVIPFLWQPYCKTQVKNGGGAALRPQTKFFAKHPPFLTWVFQYLDGLLATPSLALSEKGARQGSFPVRKSFGGFAPNPSFWLLLKMKMRNPTFKW